ncbi:Protein wntless B [Clonorchis sinensis]|uniref:Protein wntless homolog n=2 Tax=Clonorchis sinensis TaxID=79923 RepID=H2KUQ4_CLOSI|nr:Protein wntless B [Clonorchis sinensis]GAA33940.2 protein wntless homolog [Clonorchis sinensis]
MAGVVLETLNIRKLIAFGAMMFIIQTLFFLIGGLVSPSPNSSEQILMSRCVDLSKDLSKWLYVRHFDLNSSGTNCAEILPDGDLDEVAPPNLDGNQLVFVAQFPHPRDGYKLRMTRWFQQILGVLMLDIKHKFGTQTLEDNAKITFDLRLGYRSHKDTKGAWQELARSLETRPLKCVIDPEAKEKANHSHALDDAYYYECEILPLFTLASCHYDEYILNLRIPTDVNSSLARSGAMLQDVWMVEIHQNGGFTKIWFAMKSFVFPFSLLALYFFVSRVRELQRPMTVLEKTITVLGSGLIFLNCPVEWFSLIWNAPFWIVLSDVRQGFFFAVLVCFWLVFTGEHMMDGLQSGGRVYWPRLLLVAGSCTALGIFELAERGVQIRNPFYSIWSHPAAAKLGIASVVTGAVCAFCYLAYLAFVVARVLLQILSKRRLLVDLPTEQRHYYTGVIYRFSALLGYTLVCAALTVAFFIFSRVTEDQWSWGERSMEYSSAFITGVYGMWNVYVVAVLCLYAPSHKFKSDSGRELYDRLVSTTSGTFEVARPSQESCGPTTSQAETIQLCPLDEISSSRRPRPFSKTESKGLTFLRKTALE